MAQLKFKGDTNEIIYSAILNNIAYANNNAVLSGCEVSESSPNAMTVDITSGNIFFGTDEISVNAVTGLSIDNNTSGFERIDLVRVNSSGTIDIKKGVPGELPTAPDYEPDDYIVLAILRLPNGITEITNTQIKDTRVLNVGGSGSGGGTFGRHIEEITDQTSVTVTHNLGDDEPNVFVYNENNQIIIPETIEALDTNSVQITFSSSTSGKIVVYGGSGVNNAYFNYPFTSQTSLTVNHNLNNRNVLVQVIDDTGSDIIPSDITRVDENTVNITFGSAQSGTVICAGGISTVDLVKEEPIKSESDIQTISVTDISNNVSTSLSNTNSILIINEGSNNCFIDFSSTSTLNGFPLFPKGKIYLRDINISQISAICEPTKTTTLKIQFFGGDKIGSKENVEIIQHSTTETSQTSSLSGTPNYKYLLLLNIGNNNIYYDFNSTTTTSGIPIFPNDYIELENINVSDIASICDTGNTSDLRILNLY